MVSMTSFLILRGILIVQNQKRMFFPESYLQDYPNLNFEFSPFSQEEIIEIIKSLGN